MLGQNNTLGFYLPSFFRLHVGTKKPLTDINNWNDQDFSVFLHEYVHFIQDISTIYGLSRTNAIVEYLRFANNDIINKDKRRFNVPILPDPTNSDNVSLHSLISKETFGDTIEFDINQINSYIIYDHAINIPNSPINKIELVEVSCVDAGGNGRTFKFGAGCIIESMSYLLEQLTCPNFHVSPDIPYRSAELIVEHIHPNFAKNNLNILALCDISLGVSNPANYFLMILNEWKSKDAVPERPEILYEDHKTRKFAINMIENDEDHFKVWSERVKLQLKDYFNDTHFESLVKWINHTIDMAVVLRSSYPTFIIDIGRSNIKANPTFDVVFNTLGTPLLTNDANEFIYYGSKTFNQQIPIEYFWAIRQILRIFRGHHTKCELIEFCKQPESNTKVDLRCLSPWLRSKDIPACPVGLLWKHWGLKEFVPKSRR